MMILLDGHTHLHDHVRPVDFLTSARANFRACSRGEKDLILHAILCLADFPGAEGFTRFQAALKNKQLGEWELLPTAEKNSLGLVNPAGDKLWIIAGRQLVTAEKIEVMALGAAEPLQEHLPLFETIEAVDCAGALPVLPWGVGKWLGLRGKLVETAMKTYGKRIVLGDNGGRPWFWKPRLLTHARQYGVPVIPGTDPLRIASDCLRCGSFGLAFAEQLDELQPAIWVKRIIRSAGKQGAVIGVLLGVLPFVSRQLALRRGGSRE